MFAAVAIASWSLPGLRERLWCSLAMGAAGLALDALEPHGPGEAAVFAAVALASFRFPARSAMAVVA